MKAETAPAAHMVAKRLLHRVLRGGLVTPRAARIDLLLRTAQDPHP